MMEMSAELMRMLLQPELYRHGLALFSHLSESAAAMLLTAAWQGLAIALFLGVCLRVAPRVSAGLRFVTLAAGFAAIVALPFMPAAIEFFQQKEHAGAIVEGSRAAQPWLVIDARWSVALTLVWLAASLWRGIDLGVHVVRLRRLWKSAQPMPAGTLALPKLRGRKQIELCTTHELERPSVIGFFAPRILIPAWLLERMTEAELEQIVLHESEHLRRGDDWTNLLQKLSLVVFPLNPALVWIERRLCLEREMACDEGVVRRTRAPRAYAACLTSLAEHGLERRVQALSLGAWQRRPELARRVHRLLAKKPALRPAVAGSIVAVLGAGLLAGSTELARCPQMVGFASPKQEQMEDLASIAQEGDRVLRPEMRPGLRIASADQPVHATKLRATLPMRNDNASSQDLRRHAGAPKEDDSQTTARLKPFPAPATPREQLLKAEEARTTSPDAQAADPAQGWVVMTMWEQTETAAAEPLRDYATQETAEHADAAQQPARSTSQVTVTRLVWRVASPDTASGQSKNAENKNTNASGAAAQRMPALQPLPAIVPVRGGWLIFQL